MKNSILFIGRTISFVSLAALLASCSSGSSLGSGEDATGTAVSALSAPRADIEIPDSASAQQTVASMVLNEPMLFVAGNFTSISGSNGKKQARSDFAVVNVYTDEIMPLKANTNAGERLYAVAIEPSRDLVAVGGCFTKINGVSRTNLAMLNISTGNLVASVNIGDSTHCVKALAFSPDGSKLYVGGAFTAKLSAINTSTGQLINTFKPNPISTDPKVAIEVRALKADINTGGVIAGGSFTNICNGSGQHHLAAVNPNGTCGTAFDNNGSPNEVLALETNWMGDVIYAATGGGANQVIAYNSDHSWKWNGHPAMGDAQAVSFYDDKVYWGFHEGLDGNTDLRMARLNASDGTLDAGWTPPGFPDNFLGVWSVIVNYTAGIMAVGGDFHTVKVNGTTTARKHLALFTAG